MGKVMQREKLAVQFVSWWILHYKVHSIIVVEEKVVEGKAMEMVKNY